MATAILCLVRPGDLAAILADEEFVFLATTFGKSISSKFPPDSDIYVP